MDVIKITLIKNIGGILKNVENGKVNFPAKKVILNEKEIEISETDNPLLGKRGKNFIQISLKLFAIPALIILFCVFVSANIFLFSPKSLLWKMFAILPIISAWSYIWHTMYSIANRKPMSKKRNEILFFIPIISIGISVVSFQPGFYLSTLFFTLIALFIYEEYVKKEIVWLLKKGITCWKINAEEYSGFTIFYEKDEESEKHILEKQPNTKE